MAAHPPMTRTSDIVQGLSLHFPNPEFTHTPFILFRTAKNNKPGRILDYPISVICVDNINVFVCVCFFWNMNNKLYPVWTLYGLC